MERWDGTRGTVLYQADALDVLKEIASDSIDAIVTDCPSSIAFMNRSWDRDRGGRAQWVAWLASIMREGLRVLKPGGYAFVWALPRTSHWTATALEDAGFEIRDELHVALSGIDLYEQFLAGLTEEQRLAWARVLEAVGPTKLRHAFGSGFPKAKSNLKPAVEEWVLCRKQGPMRHLRIDECRIVVSDRSTYEANCSGDRGHADNRKRDLKFKMGCGTANTGRWPANLTMVHSSFCVREGTKRVRNPSGSVRGDEPSATVLNAYADRARVPWQAHGDADGFEEIPVYRCAEGQEIQCYRCGAWQAWDGEEEEAKCESCRERFEKSAEMCRTRKIPLCPVALLDRQSGDKCGAHGRSARTYESDANGWGSMHDRQAAVERSAGTASRFFHCVEANPFVYMPKASRADRSSDGAVANSHPTAKSTALMRHLIRLIAAPDETVLDMFAGSSSTGVAAIQEGVRFIGVELEQEYFEIGRERLRHAEEQAALAPPPTASAPRRPQPQSAPKSTAPSRKDVRQLTFAALAQKSQEGTG